MARDFNQGIYGVPNSGQVSRGAPENVSAIFYSNSRRPSAPAPAPPPQADPKPTIAIPSAQQIGGMLNGLIGNIFENKNWWLWVALLIIFLNLNLKKNSNLEKKRARKKEEDAD